MDNAQMWAAKMHGLDNSTWVVTEQKVL
jgi:hypothetical protein